MFKTNKKLKSKDAFSLVEALVAISILIIGILSAFILVIRTLGNTPNIQSRLIAANLAQEGMELTRQIRDTNFVRQSGFRNELSNGEYQIDIVNRELVSFNKNDFLKFDDEKKIYSYSSGNNQPFFFQRKIVINNVEENPDVFKVNVIMTWCVKKNEEQCLQDPTYTLNIEDHLYNYRMID